MSTVHGRTFLSRVFGALAWREGLQLAENSELSLKPQALKPLE